jgi:transcriptional regulator with XRE-family HTH domain
MLYIGENLKSLRKGKDLTQEEAAEILGVSAQSVSKWERGETYPDITLLPALANLYKTSVDALLGMDKINDDQTRYNLHATAYNLSRDRDYQGAISLYHEALKMYPNDESFMQGLALILALGSDPATLNQAATLCERVLAGSPSEKVRHTTRAALCFIYMKAGEKTNAMTAAINLPHIRESREMIFEHLRGDPSSDELDAYLRFIITGDSDEQDIITVDFGVNMLSVFTEHELLEKIEALRIEVGAPKTNDGYRILPVVRIRDNCKLSPNRIRVRYYADYLLDKDFTAAGDAANEIIGVLHKIAQR